MNATAPKTLDRLQGLVQLYDQGYNSPTIDNAIDKLLTAEIARARVQEHELAAQLAAYEHQYEMASEDFYRRFSAGDLGDEMDYVEWSILYELHQAILERLRILGEVTP